MKISFIGYGNIAKAIVPGLLKDKTYRIKAAAPSLPTDINEYGVQTYSDNLSVIPEADVIILAVKPALMSSVLGNINSAIIPKHCVVISIASGLSLSWFEKYLPQCAVVRAMPNIAAAMGKSATPMIANSHTTQPQLQIVESIFTRLGLITWVDNESDIDAFTALSGSGPAYIFLFMEAMIKAGVKLGINENVAKSFALQTVNGALGLATQSKLSISELRKTVTAPAGTTAAALEVLTRHHFEGMIEEAMQAACERAKQLGKI